MLIEDNELANSADLQIPQCFMSSEEALTIVREHRITWLATQSGGQGAET